MDAGRGPVTEVLVWADRVVDDLEGFELGSKGEPVGDLLAVEVLVLGEVALRDRLGQVGDDAGAVLDLGEREDRRGRGRRVGDRRGVDGER